MTDQNNSYGNHIYMTKVQLIPKQYILFRIVLFTENIHIYVHIRFEKLNLFILYTVFTTLVQFW